MNQMDQKMANLEAEGKRMVELERMSDKVFRQTMHDLLCQSGHLCDAAVNMSFADLAIKVAGFRSQVGLVMRECELRALR